MDYSSKDGYKVMQVVCLLLVMVILHWEAGVWNNTTDTVFVYKEFYNTLKIKSLQLYGEDLVH